MNRAAFLRLAVVAPAWFRHALAGGAAPPAAPPRTAAASWLRDAQSADGAWRAASYGAFRDGRALTPVVLRALAPLSGTEAACAAACRWLAREKTDLFEHYPVHLAAAVLETQAGFPRLGPLIEPAIRRLTELQCPATGGWSYSPTPLAADERPIPMRQPNLAATATAIDGLRASGLPPDDPILAMALRFVKSCQNHASGNPSTDDGGFFQMPGDRWRNKAGAADEDRTEQPRLRSYASATADGLRALLHCGERPDSPAVLAAAAWLERFAWDPTGSPDSPATLVYYTARAVARTSLLHPPLIARASAIARSLVPLQEPSGSWSNPAAELREDCPLVATSLALEAVKAIDSALRDPNQRS